MFISIKKFASKSREGNVATEKNTIFRGKFNKKREKLQMIKKDLLKHSNASKMY